MKKLCYVYYSPKGFDTYGHPEIILYELKKDRYGTYLGDQILSISGQVDRENIFPYALKTSIELSKFSSHKAISILAKLFKLCDYITYRSILTFIRKNKIPRYYHSKWLDKNLKDYWVPWKHRKHAEIWIHADLKGLKISK